MEKDVTLAERRLRNLLDVLAIRVQDLRITHLHDDALMLTFKTKKGDYEIAGTWSGTLREQFVLRHPFHKNKNILVNRFSNDAIQQIIWHLMRAGDSDAYEILFVALCNFWDQIFLQGRRGLAASLADAVADIYRLVYKNPKAMIDPHSYYKYPEEFIYFVSSSVGNTLYYFAGLHKRPVMVRALRGEIF